MPGKKIISLAEVRERKRRAQDNTNPLASPTFPGFEKLNPRVAEFIKILAEARKRRKKRLSKQENLQAVWEIVREGIKSLRKSLEPS